MIANGTRSNNGEAALELAEKCGWLVFPCHFAEGGQCSCGAVDCNSVGKHPLGRLAHNGLNNATTDAATIRKWWREEPRANVAVRTGKPSRIFVLDLDKKPDAGETGLTQLAALDPCGKGYDGIDGTPKSITGSGGRQIFFALPAVCDIRNGQAIGGRQIDVRGTGGYVMVPPSVNGKGPYEWDLPPEKYAPAAAPDWILDVVLGKTSPLNPGLQFTFEGDLATHLGANEGERNDILCRLVGMHLEAKGVDSELLPLALSWGERCKPPLPPQQIRKTVRALAEKHLNTIAAKSGSASAILIPYSAIERKDIAWLWQGRIALGKLSLLIGDPGEGKTIVATAISANVSTGTAFPDGSPCPPGKVVFITAEDGPGDTLRPRLEANGAALDNILHLDGIQNGKSVEELRLDLDRHVAVLDRLLVEDRTIRLVVFDPLSPFLGDTDSHVNAAVRGILRPLSQLAEKHGVAIVGIAHLSKATTQKTVYRSLGSIAFVAAARAAWAVVRDPDDKTRRLLMQVKNNLADSPGLAFRIEQTGQVRWDPAPITIAIDDLDMRQSAEEPSRREEAMRWLLLALENGPAPATELYELAKGLGIKKRTLDRAKADLGVKSEQVDGAWVWLPPPK